MEQQKPTAEPTTESPAQEDTHQPAQPELDLSAKQAQPTNPPIATAAPVPAPTMAPPLNPSNILAESKPVAKPTPKPAKRAGAGVGGAQEDFVARLTEETERLKKSHEDLQASIHAAQADMRIQVIRAAGVEAQHLGDDEILKLAPQVDPNSTQGREAINKWIDDHPGLVSAKFKIQAPQNKKIAASAIENKAVQSLWGTTDAVSKTVDAFLGGK